MAFVMPISAFLYLKIDKPVLVYLNNVLCGRKRTDPAIYAAPLVASNALEGVVTHASPMISPASAS
jgi:hypothetical protein